MRCSFNKGKQRDLLLFAKASLGLPWRKLALNLGVGSTTLRDWRDEKYLMGYSVFLKIVEICPECRNFENFIVELKEDNWGQSWVVLEQNSAGTDFLTLNIRKKA